MVALPSLEKKRNMSLRTNRFLLLTRTIIMVMIIICKVIQMNSCWPPERKYFQVYPEIPVSALKRCTCLSVGTHVDFVWSYLNVHNPNWKSRKSMECLWTKINFRLVVSNTFVVTKGRGGQNTCAKCLQKMPTNLFKFGVSLLRRVQPVGQCTDIRTITYPLTHITRVRNAAFAGSSQFHTPFKTFIWLPENSPSMARKSASSIALYTVFKQSLKSEKEGNTLTREKRACERGTQVARAAATYLASWLASSTR